MPGKFVTQGTCPTAIIALTRPGLERAQRLQERLPGSELWAPAPLVSPDTAALRPFREPLSDRMGELFQGYRALVFFLALGAVVRLIAPHLRGKGEDPAVVAVDDTGRWAISVLSGHAAGANALTREVARILGAEAVITTASEGHGLPILEELGREWGWSLEASPEALKRVSAALINGQPVGLFQDAGEPLNLELENLHRYASLEEMAAAGISLALVVTDRVLEPSLREPRWVLYRPRTLVVGLGCSRGVSAEEIEAALRETLRRHALSWASLALVATVDRKRDEPGLVAFVRHHGLPLELFPAESLDRVPVPNPSPRVRRSVGTRSVAEAAALLASGARALRVPKQRYPRVTVALSTRARPWTQGFHGVLQGGLV